MNASTDSVLFTDHKGRARAPRTESEGRMAAQQAEAVLAATKGCPTCGRPVRRNLAITGWIQCEQYGAVGFRADGALPACSYQGFLPKSR